MTGTPFENVLITGASSGLGRGLALHYARAGATVHAVARRGDALASLAAEAAAAGVGRVVPVVLDVTDAEALAAAVGAAERAAGGALDLVVANAGAGAPTSGRHMDWRVVHRLLQLNVVAACDTVCAALPAMVARGRGTVAAVGSLAGFRGLPRHGAYSASKAALHTFMESLRVDLRGTGVRAVTIQPGFVKTEMTAGARFQMPFLMELDAAVAVMARGLERGQAEICFPQPLSGAMRAARFVPRALWEAMAGRPRAARQAGGGEGEGGEAP